MGKDGQPAGDCRQAIVDGLVAANGTEWQEGWRVARKPRE